MAALHPRSVDRSTTNPDKRPHAATSAPAAGGRTEAARARVAARAGDLHHNRSRGSYRGSLLAQRRTASAAAERLAVVRALGQLEPGDGVESTAQRITGALRGLPSVDVALIFEFVGAADIVVIAMSGPEAYPLRRGDPLPAARAQHLRDLSLRGPWAERWAPAAADGAYAASLTRAGLRAVAFAPIGAAADPVGLLVVGTIRNGRSELQDNLPVVTAFATSAWHLIGNELAARRDRAAGRAALETVIADRAFRPVFQPIVLLGTGRAVGYEALTRFADGRPPDVVFGRARELGLGTGFEAATLRAAVEASGDLPTGAWLSLNVSAEFLTTDGRLPGILAPRTRPIVVEVSEHDAVADYRVLRSALSVLGPDVRVAADDAGVGVANFAHLVELRPDFVKVDASMVRGVDHDLTRQALIAGLRHFTRATDTWLIAEGIETREERQALAALDVELGQGYLFARPAPASGFGRDEETPWPTS